MTLDKTQLNNITPRQKIIAVISLVIMGVLIWQVMGLFGGTSSAPAPAVVKPSPAAPQTASLPETPKLTQQQTDLLRLQQEMQEKYVTTLNELQMLKLTQELAETNNKIAGAKLATIKAQKDVVDLLSTPALEPSTAVPVDTTQPGSDGVAAAPPPVETIPDTNYTVVSVSQASNKWSAVLSDKTNLYSVTIGDVLSPDKSVVISIDKTGVLLEKGGAQRKVSLIPVI